MTEKKSAPNDQSQYSVPTQLMHGRAQTSAWDYSHHVVPPITASSTFRLDSAQRGAAGFGSFTNPSQSDGSEVIYFYDRMGEPNNNMLQHALATAEQTDVAVTFGSGMGAVHAAACFALNKGSEIISHKTIYGCSYSLFTEWLPKFGVKTSFCDLRNPEAFLPFVNENSRVLYLESPANPTLELLDLEAIAAAVKKVNVGRSDERKIITVIDNTFATPYCQRPIGFGIDVVLHSLTKGLSGFGTEMGGVVCTRKEFEERLVLFRKDFGAVLAPQSAWHILTHGMTTLHLRVPKQQSSALNVARFLESHPAIERVSYPGLESFPQHELAKRMMRDYNGNFAPGSMVYFVLKGKSPEDQKTRGLKMMDYVAKHSYCITLAVSLGQLRTLIEHPSSMTHSAYPAEEQLKRGMEPGGIRLAIGIEEEQDIIRDLELALNQ